MRITPNITANNSLYNLQQGRAKLDKLQELTATGVNINRPSDDPIGTSLLLSITDQLKAGAQYASNIDKATTSLQVSSTALQGMAKTMLQAKELIATISSGSTDANERANVVSQLTTLKQSMIDMGNTQLGNQYVFGGAKSTTPPFSSAAPYYSGDETTLKVEIGSGTTQQINIPGNQLLTGSNPLGGPLPYGTTNILKTFDDLIIAVTGDATHPNGDIAGIQAGANSLDDGADQITKAQADAASRLMRLDSTAKMNTNNKNTLDTIVGNTQIVDYAKLAVELTNQQTAFQASLSATAKVTQLSLLDYMR